MTDANDEGRHPAGEEQLWNESWYFDFAAADGSIGGYVRLGLYPNLEVAWYWAYLVGDGAGEHGLLTVRHHEAALPKAGTLEVREEGLWSALHCETPNEHWSIGLEAFAVSLEHPAESYRGERGDKVALGFDLEWENEAPRYDYPGVTRYEVPCRVSGEILVGKDRIAFDGPGQRDHSWGVRDWWRVPHLWTAGAIEDGTRFHGTRVQFNPETAWQIGYTMAPGADAVTQTTTFGADIEFTADDDQLPVRTAMQLGELDMVCTPIGTTAIPMVAPDGRVARIPRSMCRFDVADGRSGVGWAEWNQPPPQ